MINHYKNCLMPVPDVTVFINCDTKLAINLRMFNLSENDEFVFTIKNYDYKESSYVFMFRARKSDENENGEVIFRIKPEDSRKLKYGAFYNFAVLKNAFDQNKETEYKKLTSNGNIILEYGAQDLMFMPDEDLTSEIVGLRLELIDDTTEE